MNFLEIKDKKERQNFLDKAIFKTFFHSLDWEEFLESQFKWLKFERYVWQNQALLSLARIKIFGKEKLVSHPFCEYGGILPLAFNINFQEIKNDLLTEFKNNFKISFHPENLKYFIDFNAPEAGRETYFIDNFDKKNKEIIWQGLRKSVRQEVEKAKSSGILIKRCETEKELKDFYRLYLLKAKKHKTPAYPFSFFDYFLKSDPNLQMTSLTAVRQANAPNDTNRVEIILALHKDRVIAGSTFLFYGKFIHYFLNASDEKYGNLGANHLILWSQIGKSTGNNFEVFDLGGTRKGSSLEVFKSGWGAEKKPIFELKNYQDGSCLKSGFLRNLWGRLPIFVTRIVSPYFLRFKI